MCACVCFVCVCCVCVCVCVCVASPSPPECVCVCAGWWWWCSRWDHAFVGCPTPVCTCRRQHSPSIRQSLAIWLLVSRSLGSRSPPVVTQSSPTRHHASQSWNIPRPRCFAPLKGRGGRAEDDRRRGRSPGGRSCGAAAAGRRLRGRRLRGWRPTCRHMMSAW